jgi:hypothetical protein
MFPPTYDLTFEVREQYLYAKATAEQVNEQVARAYLQEICEKLRETGLDRVMIDRDMPGVLSDAAVFNISRDSAQWFRGVKVAIVNRHQPFHDSLKFSMNVAANRGGHNELFSDEESAERWLLS